MVVTSSEELASRVARMRDWGQTRKNLHELPGFNYRMTAFQGAVLRTKLVHLEDWTEARRTLSRRYNELLPSDKMRLPVQKPDCRHVHHLYVVRVPSRDAVQKALSEKGIYTALHYPLPVHLQPYYRRRFDHHPGEFPNAEQLGREVLSLPLYPRMTEEDVTQVVKGFREAVAGCSELEAA